MKCAPNLPMRRGLLAVGVLLAVLGSGMPAVAADSVIDLPKGQACRDFDLRVEITQNPHRVSKEFYDKNGNLVRVLTAGKGNQLSFSNLSTGAILSLKANGSVERISQNPDGTQTYTTTGHNVLILFPTDVPAGPSTTLYVGRVVFTVDGSGVFTLKSTSGKSMDICAALSS